MKIFIGIVIVVIIFFSLIMNIENHNIPYDLNYLDQLDENYAFATFSAG